MPKRHFTVSAFVSAQGHTLLHWHRKNRMWLPSGGHIEPGEDPYQAARREAEEEAGFPIEILPTVAPFPFDAPSQLPAPVTILIEDIPPAPDDPAHQHIDYIYFARPQGFLQTGRRPNPPNDAWHWIAAQALRDNAPLAPAPGAPLAALMEDVRVLGLAAIARADQESAALPPPPAVRDS